MKYIIHLIIASILSIISALFIFSYFNGFIIFTYPSYQTDINNFRIQLQVTKKPITFYYWHNDKWHTEKTELIWSEDMAQNIQYLINSLFTLLDEEQIMRKKVTVQTLLLSEDKQHAYCSFDHNLLNKEQSTYQKWLLIEGLLKTLRENGIIVQDITFLVHHQPMHDMHLDFTNPWPLTGFMSQ